MKQHTLSEPVCPISSDSDDDVYQDAVDYLRTEDRAWDLAIRQAVELYPDQAGPNSALKELARTVPGAALIAARIMAAAGPSGPDQDPEWERLNKLATGEVMRPLFPDADAPDEVPPCSITGVLASSGLDWLELTDIQDASGRSFMKALTIPEAEWVDLPTGMRGYRRRRVCGGLTILTDGAEGMGANLIVTGDGCRELEARDHLFSWQRFARAARDKHKMRCGRLDLYKDERDGVVTVDAVRQKLATDSYTSRSQDYTSFERHKRRRGRRGNMVTVGSRQSERYLRVYDKAQEQAPRRGKKGEREKWLKAHGPHVRFELEHKDKVADALWAKIAEVGVSDELVSGLLGCFIAFKTSPAVGQNANRVAPWEEWLTFLKNAPHVILAVDYVKNSLAKTEEWLSHQAEVALWQLWCKYGGDVSWVLRFIRRGAMRAKPHHLARLKGERITPPKLVDAGQPWTLMVNRDQLVA